MKKALTLCLALLVVVLAFASCGEDASGTPPVAKEIYSFSYNNVEIYPGQVFSIVYSQLGEPDSYFEAASCAFDGLDKLYTYGSMQINVSALNDVDTIYSISLLDDSLTIPKGICIGSNKSEVLAAYGNDCTDNGTSLVYTSEHTSLVFLVRDGYVTSIQYRYAE